MSVSSSSPSQLAGMAYLGDEERPDRADVLPVLPVLPVSGAELAARPNPPLPPAHSWRNDPLYVRLSPRAPSIRRTDGKEREMGINTRDAICEFATDLFVGRTLLRVDGAGPATDYFQNRSRKIYHCVQGRFTTAVPCHEALSGFEMHKPLMGLPALFSLILRVVQKLSPALGHNLLCKTPYALSPLAATAQHIHVSRPGSEPDLMQELEEDLTGWGLPTMSIKARKRFFSSPASSQHIRFDPNLVYTFDFYQHMFSPLTMEVHVPLGIGTTSIDLEPYINLQPVPLMARLRHPLTPADSKEEQEQGPAAALLDSPPNLTPAHLASSEVHLWHFEVWHKALVPPELWQSAEATTDRKHVPSAPSKDGIVSGEEQKAVVNRNSFLERVEVAKRTAEREEFLTFSTNLQNRGAARLTSVLLMTLTAMSDRPPPTRALQALAVVQAAMLIYMLVVIQLDGKVCQRAPINAPQAPLMGRRLIRA
eukprot:g73858.t1